MRVIVYDATSKAGVVRIAWVIASRLLALWHGFVVIPATSWRQVAAELLRLGCCIDEIQYWGHGAPGYIFLGGIGTRRVPPELAQIAPLLRPESLLWLRTCSTFAGRAGHEFARAWTGSLLCRVASSTHIIGLQQSGQHSLRPGERPTWPTTEGLDDKDCVMWSSKAAPNTLSCLDMSLPEEW